MMDAVELVPNSARIAELWAKIKAELDTKLDKGDTAAAEEVTEMLDEVFGASGGGPPAEVPDIAAEEGVAEMLDEVFGSSGSQSQSGIATEQEVTEMLNEVFSSSDMKE